MAGGTWFSNHEFRQIFRNRTVLVVLEVEEINDAINLLSTILYAVQNSVLAFCRELFVRTGNIDAKLCSDLLNLFLKIDVKPAVRLCQTAGQQRPRWICN